MRFQILAVLTTVLLTTLIADLRNAQTASQPVDFQTLTAQEIGPQTGHRGSGRFTVA